MAVMIVAHPIPGFSGRVTVEDVGLSFIGGFTGPVNVPSGIQAQLVGEGFTLNASPSNGHPLAYVTHQELADPNSEPGLALRAASVSAVQDAIADGDIQVGSPDAATIEELFASALFNGTLVSGVYPVLIAPFALKVTSLSLAYLNGTSPIPSEDLNYWTIGFNRYRANVESLIAAKGTRNNSGLNEAWPRRTDWNLDLTSFSEANATCQKGDIIAVRFTKTGTIVDPIDVMMTVRYVPL